jgi:hypothetical protein
MAARIAITSKVAANSFGVASTLLPKPNIRRVSDAMIEAIKIEIFVEKAAK